MATVLSFGLLSAPIASADAYTYINTFQCKANHSAIANKKPAPYVGKLRLPAGQGNLQNGNTINLKIESQYVDDIKAGALLWSSASNGVIKVNFVDYVGPDVIVVRDEAMADFGRTYQYPTRIGIGTQYFGQMDSRNRQFVVSHEIGHAMGLAHSCVGDLMKARDTWGKYSYVPTKSDVAGVIQGRVSNEDFLRAIS